VFSADVDDDDDDNDAVDMQ